MLALPSPRNLVLAASLLAASLAPAEANSLSADFGDIASGAINGKAGGSGWNGSWSGSANGTVASGDLTSPLYAITQSGTAQHLQSSNTSGIRQNFRLPASALTGEIWFSYIAMTASSTTGAGLSFNAPTASPFQDTGNAFLQFVGTSLIYRFGQTTDQSISNAITLNSPTLVVGEMILGSGATDSIRVWANPNLIADPNIFDAPTAISLSSVSFADSITTVGAIVHNSGGVSTVFGQLDAIRISDGGGIESTAIRDVTGVPEPSAGLLACAGMLIAGVSRRRRHG